MKTLLLLLVLATLAGCGGNTTPTMRTETRPGDAPTPAKAPDENAALDAMAKIKEAQATYFKLNRRYALTTDELLEAHLLKNEPTPAQTGYEFKLRPAADAQSYKLSVVPATSAPPAGHFFMDQTGVIHAEAGKDATADSPALAK